MDLTINYNEQMLNYYPEVVKSIREFQALIETQSLQIDELHQELNKILNNAYITDADEQRISEWEQYLGIQPLPQGDDSLETWLSDRRETILARMYNAPKLNTKTISDIVHIFTGGTAKSYFKDGIIHVLISPPKTNKQYKFENVERELNKIIPAHLQIDVRREYQLWELIESSYPTWNDVSLTYRTWGNVLIDSKLEFNKLGTTTFEEFVLR